MGRGGEGEKYQSFTSVESSDPLILVSIKSFSDADIVG